MRQFATLLQDMFSVTAPRRRPASSSRMMLRDAPRTCGSHAISADRPAAASTASQPFEVRWYRSESDLQDQWQGMSDALAPSARLTVVLVLGDFLCGSLRELIRQRRTAHRLVIVPQAGHWPGIHSFGDLALAAGALGWNSIEICRSFGDAPTNLSSALGPSERLLVVLPTSDKTRDVM